MALRALLLVSVLAIGLALPAFGQTLAEVLRAAEVQNPQLDAGRADAGLAIEALEEARARGRTTVTLSGSAGYETSDTNRDFAFNVGDRPIASVELEAALPVYTGGRIAAGIRSAEAGIDAAEASLEDLRQAIFLQALTAYMDVLRDKETVRIRQNNVNVLIEQTRAAQDRFEVGVVTRTDVALAEARLEEARAAEAAAQAQLESSRANFQFVIGEPPGLLAPPPPLPDLPADFDSALAHALEGNPALIAARRDVTAASEAIEVARADGRAQIEIVGAATAFQDFDQDDRDTSLSALARGTIPIFQGGLVSSQVRSAKLRREQARLAVQTLERQVRADLAAAWFGYIAAEKSVEASRRQVIAAEIAYEGAQQEFEVGLRTTFELLDSEQDLFEAQLAVVTAERDSYVAAHRLLRVMGELRLSLFQ